jgi:hypothetical protein
MLYIFRKYSRRLEAADIRGDFVFHAEIAPAKPMITEDLTEPVMASGVIRVLER